MGARCSACGFHSTERALFRPESGRVPFRRTLCLACKAPEPWPKATIAATAWGLVALVLMASTLAGADLEPWGYGWLVLMSFGALCPLAVAVHEVGHALAAVLVGRKPYLLSFGVGASLASWRLGDLQIVLARDLGRGFVQAYPQGPEPRWRTSLYLTGGFIANLMAVGAVVALLAVLSPDAWAPAGKCLASVAIGLVLANGFAAVQAITPRQMKWGGGRLPSDGRRLVDLWRQRPAPVDYALLHLAFRGDRLIKAGRWREAQALFATAFARAPDHPGFLGCLVHVVARDQGPAAAMACYAEHRAAFEAAGREGSPMYGYAAANVAWQALRTGDAAWLDLAAELSEQAIALDAVSAPVRATRGAALMAKGDRAAGGALLTAALRDVEDPVDKAEFCSFLAREAWTQGEDALGANYQRLEAHLLTTALARRAAVDRASRAKPVSA